MKSTNGKTGDVGENAVVKYLKRRFYRILECNFNCRWGELDIVAKRGRFLCFVEVKTRSKNSLGRPAEAVDKYKQNKIIKTAYYYLKENEDLSYLMPRFDVAEVYIDNHKPRINYIDNAFDQNEYNYFS